MNVLAVNGAIEKMDAVDGILLGSPPCVPEITAGTKALVARSGMVARANGAMFRRKAGAGVVAVRRDGARGSAGPLNKDPPGEGPDRGRRADPSWFAEPVLMPPLPG